jgi:hypothetical protein
MFDDPNLSTTLANPRSDIERWARQEARSRTTADELFYGATRHPHALDSTGVAPCRPLTLAALIAAAILSAALTAYIALRGLPPHKHTPAQVPASDASHARFGPLN